MFIPYLNYFPILLVYSKECFVRDDTALLYLVYFSLISSFTSELLDLEIEAARHKVEAEKERAAAEWNRAQAEKGRTKN